jgi:leucyl-tRNA synthetase
MTGREVFQPIGFDSFGIHTENFALRVGEHPRTLTERTIANYRRQLRSIGAAWDWDHEVVTSDPSYYRWTQWIFVELFDAGLAVRREAPVNWCPSCQTVLANEQLEGGGCERCGTLVVERTMLQWFLRITAYAEQLLRGLDDLDWPESAKRAQRRWIGRSEGVEIDFEVPERASRLRVFTTRPDTLFGVTFLAVPPGDQRLVAFAGASAVHPATGERIPVVVADHVVSGYGSDGVMGVPAHDTRDHRFALTNGLPIVRVVQPSGGVVAPADEPWTGDGRLIDSGRFSGLSSADARDAIAHWLEERGMGRRTVRYRLRDWLISRQRYWGPPIPVVYCDECGTVPVPRDDLPVLLPDVADFLPTGTGVSPLASVEAFVRTTCPSCGGQARRETDVSDTFLDSAWYFLRYPSSDVDDRAWDPERTARLLPVDSYAGGPEHVVRHHLYARFLTMALHDLGLLPFAEPFPRIRLHEMLTKDGANPDRYVEEHGADATRMYLLFIGPWDEGGDFSDAGVVGIERFLQRTWRLIVEPHVPGGGDVDLRPLDRAIATVGGHLEAMRFNTAIAALMEVVRWAAGARPSMTEEEWRRVARSIVRLLAPFAPYLAEELSARCGQAYSVHHQPWPAFDASALADDVVTVVIQVDGRMRDRVRVPAGTDRARVLELALQSRNVRRHLVDGMPGEVIFVPDRVMNLVSRGADG